MPCCVKHKEPRRAEHNVQKTWGEADKGYTEEDVGLLISSAFTAQVLTSYFQGISLGTA